MAQNVHSRYGEPVPAPPAESVVADNPHPAFDRVTAAGYSLRYRLSRTSSPTKLNLVVEALSAGAVVGRAEFADDVFAAHCQNVSVDEGHHRRGLATAMYLLAEAVYGKPLWNFWGNDDTQSAAAKALWDDPNRPFGRPRPR